MNCILTISNYIQYLKNKHSGVINTVEVKYFTLIWLIYYTLIYMYIAHLQVELCRECSIFHIADIILGKVQIGEVSKATE